MHVVRQVVDRRSRARTSTGRSRRRDASTSRPSPLLRPALRRARRPSSIRPGIGSACACPRWKGTKSRGRTSTRPVATLLQPARRDPGKIRQGRGDRRRRSFTAMSRSSNARGGGGFWLRRRSRVGRLSLRHLHRGAIEQRRRRADHVVLVRDHVQDGPQREARAGEVEDRSLDLGEGPSSGSAPGARARRSERRSGSAVEAARLVDLARRVEQRHLDRQARLAAGRSSRCA